MGEGSGRQGYNQGGQYFSTISSIAPTLSHLPLAGLLGKLLREPVDI